MTSAGESLSICIVSHNNQDTVAACIDACLAAAGELEIEIIVFDNASRDDTASIVLAFGEPVRLIRSPANLGFGAGNNRAMAEARGEWILLLNPDTEPQPGSFAAMIDYLTAHPEVGMAGAALQTPDGRRQRSVRGFPTFANSLQQFFPFSLFSHFQRAYDAYRMRDFDYEQSAEAPALMGTAMMARREVFTRVGGFDERFFMYFEDVDLSMAITRAGLKSAYVAEAKILHHSGHTARQFRRLVYCERLRSMMIYFSKYQGRDRTRCFKCLFIPLILCSSLCRIPLDLLSSVRYACQGDTYRRKRKAQQAWIRLVFVIWDWWRVAAA